MTNSPPTGGARIAPVEPQGADADTAALLDSVPNGTESNFFRTLVRHPRIFKRWVRYAPVLLHGEVPARDRELLVLRAASRADSAYLWSHHYSIALDAGLSEEEIARVARGPEDPQWSADDALVLRAADELLDSHTLGPATWDALAQRYNEHQLMEALTLIGFYFAMGYSLNSWGTELESSAEDGHSTPVFENTPHETPRGTEFPTLTTPRIPPVPLDERVGDVAELLSMAGPFGGLNIFATMVRHPRLYKRWLPFGTAMLYAHLPPRDRELLILRTAYRCECIYEASQHEAIADGVGLSSADVERIRQGDYAGLTPHDAALVRAVDELIDEHRISEPTWQTLAATLDESLLIEVPMVVGHYFTLGLTLNAMGVLPDPESLSDSDTDGLLG